MILRMEYIFFNIMYLVISESVSVCSLGGLLD